MSKHELLIRDVSDTALWVAAYRADESDRPDALFRDSHARVLAGERGAEIARRVKQPAVRIGVVLRTALMDESVQAALSEGWCDTVLNLGAGLDARPYRLHLPPALRWVEVDKPALVEYKAAALCGVEPRCRLERIGLDLEDREQRRALLRRICGESSGALVITEGVLGYLERPAVASLAEDLHAEDACRSWLTDLLGANVVRRVRNAGDELKADGSRVVFAPEEGTTFFGSYGWRESAYADVFTEMARLGRDSALTRLLRAIVSRLPEERRKRFERGMGVARLERVAA